MRLSATIIKDKDMKDMARIISNLSKISPVSIRGTLKILEMKEKLHLLNLQSQFLLLTSTMEQWSRESSPNKLLARFARVLEPKVLKISSLATTVKVKALP